MKLEDLFKPNKLLWQHVISEDGALREIALFEWFDDPDHFILAQTRGDVFEGEDLEERNIHLPRDVVLMLINALQQATDPKSKPDNSEGPPV